MRKALCFVLLVSTSGVVIAQTSAYQDANGNSSISFLSGNANLVYNVSQTKFSLGLVHIPDGQSQKFTWQERGIYGVNFSGKPDTDLTNQIFQSGNSPATIAGGGVIGSHRVWAPLGSSQTDNTFFTDDWFLVRIDYTKSTFSTVASGSAAPVAQHFNGFSIAPTYNCSLQTKKVMMLFGASGGISRVNNVDQLKQVSVDTTESQNGTVSIVQTTSAYLGDYAEAYNVPIYSDLVFIPNKTAWLSFDAFERANVLKTDGYTEGGVGIFVAQPSKPTKVLGGISVAWKNGSTTIGIVGGWSF
jgi:hypothetical protein